MRKEQFLGQLRALLTVVGAALATYGYHAGHQWEPVIGVAVLAVSLGWSIYYKEGWEAIQSMIRKLVSIIGTAVVTYDLMGEEQTAALVAVAGPLLAMIGSWRTHGPGKYPPAGGVVPLLVALLTAVGLCGALGCADYQLRGGVRTDHGTITLDERGVIAIEVDRRSGK